ncbi:hypothetical protein [Kitasatospora sp. NPDC094015]|uniref:hypothetical protein n=1 Tax=Kitasatospora sp. NPDC094015 TaxID=3155205 RepID=UPI00333392C7
MDQLSIRRWTALPLATGAARADSPPALMAVAATSALGVRFALIGHTGVTAALLALAAAVVWLLTAAGATRAPIRRRARLITRAAGPEGLRRGSARARAFAAGPTGQAGGDDEAARRRKGTGDMRTSTSPYGGGPTVARPAWEGGRR